MDWQKRNFWFFVFDKGSSGPKWSGKLFDWKLTFANSRSLFIFFTVHTNLWSLKKKKNIYSLVRTNKNKKNLLVRTVQHPRRSTVGGTSLCYILIGRGKSVSHLISWSVVIFHKGSSWLPYSTDLYLDFHLLSRRWLLHTGGSKMFEPLFHAGLSVFYQFVCKIYMSSE